MTTLKTWQNVLPTNLRAANKVLPKAGLNGFDWAFVQGSTFVLRLNFSDKIPAFGNTQTVGGNVKKTNYAKTNLPTK